MHSDVFVPKLCWWHCFISAPKSGFSFVFIVLFVKNVKIQLHVIYACNFLWIWYLYTWPQITPIYSFQAQFLWKEKKQDIEGVKGYCHIPIFSVFRTKILCHYISNVFPGLNRLQSCALTSVAITADISPLGLFCNSDHA